MRPLSAPQTAREKERFWGAEVEEIQASVAQWITSGYGLRGLVDPDLPKVLHPAGVDDCWLLKHYSPTVA